MKMSLKFISKAELLKVCFFYELLRLQSNYFRRFFFQWMLSFFEQFGLVRSFFKEIIRSEK